MSYRSENSRFGDEDDDDDNNHDTVDDDADTRSANIDVDTRFSESSRPDFDQDDLRRAPITSRDNTLIAAADDDDVAAAADDENSRVSADPVRFQGAILDSTPMSTPNEDFKKP